MRSASLSPASLALQPTQRRHYFYPFHPNKVSLVSSRHILLICETTICRVTATIDREQREPSLCLVSTSSTMDEIFQKLNLANNLWQTQKCRHQKFFEATDVWLYPATGEIDVDSQTVQESNLKTWLADEVRGSDSQARFLLQRFVWVEIDVKGREIMLDSSIGKTLIKSFKLSLANGYLTSATSGITAFPPSPSENGEVSTFALGHAPKIAATWSQEHFTSWLGRPATTRSMVFMAKESIEATQGFLKKSWTASLYHNNMFPAFLLAIQMGMEISDSQRKDIEKVHKIERSTGFHTFTHRAEGDIIKDSGKLVVFTSGLAAKLASMERNSKVLRMLLDFVASTIDQKSAAMKTFEKQEEDDQWLRAKKESRELLSHHISVLRNRLAMLDLETDYLTKRVKMQTESVSLFYFSHIQDAG